MRAVLGDDEITRHLGEYQYWEDFSEHEKMEFLLLAGEFSPSQSQEPQAPELPPQEPEN